MVTSHLKRQTTLKLNINDIKRLHIPESSQWDLNEKYFKQALEELQTEIKIRKVQIDLKSIGALISDIVEGKELNIQFFVIPDWPCMDWYKQLHDKVRAEAIKLPKEEDLFMIGGKPVGVFAWEHLIFELK